MLQFATPREIFERPATEFVASFVGEPQMNLYDCRLVRSDRGMVAEVDGFVVPLDAQWVKANALERFIGQTLRLGIRPEHISIRDQADADHGIAATLYSFEPTGAENLYILRCGGSLITTRTSTTETAHLGKTEGTGFFLRFDPSWLHLFDKEGGQTLAYAAATEGA